MRLGTPLLVAVGAVGLLLGNLARVPGLRASDGRAMLVLLDLALVPLWLVLGLDLLAGRRRLVLDRITRALLAFVAAASISTFLAWFRWEMTTYEGFAMTSYLIRWILYAGWFALVVTTPDAGHDDAVGWRHLERVIVIFALFGVLQSMLLPGFAQLLPDGALWDRQGRRLVSTLLDPNFAGGLVAIALLFTLARENEGDGAARGGIALFGIALLLTLSRSAILGVIAGIVTIALTRGLRARVVWLMGVAGVVLLPFATVLFAFADRFNKLTVDASALQRLIPWMRSLILWRDHPVFGVGFNAVRVAQRSYGWREVGGAGGSYDGGLLFILVMTGLAGILTFGWLLMEVWRAGRMLWRSDEATRATRAFAVGGWAATVAVMVQSFFTNTLLLPFVMFPLWVIWGRLARMTRTATPMLGVSLLFGLSACDPCLGVVGCDGAPVRSATGTIVSRETQAPVAGVRVAIGEQAVFTDRRGQWTLTLAASTDSVQSVSVTQGTDTYAVPVSLPLRTRNGDGTNLGTWYDRPVFRFIVRPVYRGQVLPGAVATFTSTSGDLTIGAGANGQGYLSFFGDAPVAGSVAGRLEISHPMIGTRGIDPFGIVADHRVDVPKVRGDVPIDGRQRWGGEVFDRRVGVTAKVAGVAVTFERTGGVDITPRIVRSTTNAQGVFFFDFEAFASGVVRGTVTVTPNSGWAPVVYRDVSFTTHPPGSSGYLGVFGFGERWAWAIELWRHDMLIPMPDLPYRLVRVGGLAINPTTFQGRTDAGGRFYVSATVPDSGTVFADLYITPPGQSERLVRRFALRTSTSDQPQFAGVHGYGPALRYQIPILDAAGAPVANALVRFERTGGIAATPVTTDGRTDAAGRLFVFYLPQADGVLEGRVSVTPGPPWPPGATFTFDRVTLATVENGDVQVASPIRLPAP